MHPKPVSNFKDYKSYLKHREKIAPRGFRANLARETKIATSFFTLVMTTDANFTPDQGAEIAHVLEMKAQDARYFLGLVLLARAKTPRLKRMLKDLFS